VPIEVEMCEFYKVEMRGRGFKITCVKNRQPSIKCHNKRDECSDYNPSTGLTLEEIKEKYGL